MNVWLVYVTHHRTHPGWTDLWISRGFTQKEAEEKVIKELTAANYPRQSYSLYSKEPELPSVIAEEV